MPVGNSRSDERCLDASSMDGEMTRRLVISFPEDGVEPLAICRSFHGVRPDFVEILEEFRLFHNLCPAAHSDNLQKIGDGGVAYDVVRFEGSGVWALRKEVRQFLAVRGASLLIFIDNVRYSPQAVTTISEEQRNQTLTGPSHYLEFFADNVKSLPLPKLEKGMAAFSKLMGKTVVPPLPLSKSGVWPHNEAEELDYPNRHRCRCERRSDFLLM